MMHNTISVRRVAANDPDRRRRDYELIRTPLWALITVSAGVGFFAVVWAYTAKSFPLPAFLILWGLFALACAILIPISARLSSRCPQWLRGEYLDENRFCLRRAYAPSREFRLSETVIYTRSTYTNVNRPWVQTQLYDARIEDSKKHVLLTMLTRAELRVLLSSIERSTRPWPSHRDQQASSQPCSSLRADLEIRWSHFAEHIGIGPDVEQGIFATLCDLYDEPHRAYHNLIHVFDCLDHFENYVDAEYNEIELAIWFHDAIYNPASSTNEQDSADLLCQSVRGTGLDQPLIDAACRLILITKHHEKALEPDEQILADIDRAILASHPDVYDRYALSIREEYDFANEEEFNRGRAAYLQSQLALERIFFTDWAEMHGFEDKARRNMRRELERLASK